MTFPQNLAPLGTQVWRCFRLRDDTACWVLPYICEEAQWRWVVGLKVGGLWKFNGKNSSIEAGTKEDNIQHDTCWRSLSSRWCWSGFSLIFGSWEDIFRKGASWRLRARASSLHLRALRLEPGGDCVVRHWLRSGSPRGGGGGEKCVCTFCIEVKLRSVAGGRGIAVVASANEAPHCRSGKRTCVLSWLGHII